MKDIVQNMNMKTTIVKVLTCMLLTVAAVANVNAANGIIEEKNYKICPGDTIMVDTRKTVVYSDTILYDTIRVTDPSKDSIYVYVVNVYPTFLGIDTERTIERGTHFTWHELDITKAGNYEKVYKSKHGCDSIYRITVRERVTSHVIDTLCLGSMKTFGSQTLTQPGIYYDTLHYASYDSVIILSLIGHKPDTILTDIRIPEGTSFDWQGDSYDTQGVYDRVFTDRFGCDSLQRLVLTVYHVDTIDTTVVVCPGESFTWHGHTGGETNLYEYPGVRDNGDQVWYRLNLTVKTMSTIDTTLTICDDETITFNGKVYANAGEYYDQYTCDTLFRLTVVKHPTKLHVQTGVLDRTHPYYWRYILDGEQKVDTILAPGIYEYTTHDPETGCNEIYRLILTKDETSYHFITDTVICENEYFEWRGKKGLNRQGIGTTTHYFDRYRTAADQDSIYELILRVQPVPRTSQTIKFCDDIVWKGTTYTESTVLVDTFTSIQYRCDSIVTTYLSKGVPFHKHDTASIRPGETLEWRGQIIIADGLYKDEYVTAAGCDSVYSLGVGLEEVPVATPTRTWRVSICEGDFYEWEVTQGRYFNAGTYVDTVFNANDPQVVDSLNILIVTQNPKYVTRERITSHSFPTYYRGQEFYRDQEVEFHYTSKDGCDSVIIVKAEFEIAHFEEDVVICPGESYIWDWDGLTYRETGRYFKTVKDQNNNDSVEHILNLTVRYIPETYIKKTICKGGSYTYGDRTLTEAGVYDFTFHETGCDSIVHLALNVVSPDTIRYVHHMNEHDSYTWHGETYSTTGVYYFHGTNRWGCDSLEILQLTVNHVDTIDTTATICPNEIPFVWHGITASQSGKFTGTEEINGIINYYRLNLTVREIVYIDTTFTVCGDQSVTFHGATYSEAGIYPNYIACDTIVNVRIVNHPQQVYETHARMTDDHGYQWTYWHNGEKHEKELFDIPGTYEYESPNSETGCSEIWRLILTFDQNSYLFQETQTICEGDDFTWHGLNNLSSITGTNTYRVEYETHAGQDSIYELTLTVTPVERTVRTITFCGETEWKGKSYTNSAVVYDTISLANGCYRIERINLDKAQSYYFRESKEWPQGKVLIWHGQNITTDGVYYDRMTTVQGCDSVYELTVSIIPAAPENNQYAEELSTCEGDTIIWRDKYIWRSGTYVDTVWADGKVKVDSIFTLSFTAWPAPKDTIYEHLYTCNENGIIRYNGHDYTQNTTVVTNYHTIHGCDSVVKTYLHFNEALYLRDTARVPENTLPYAWTPTGTDTTIYLMEPSTYQYKQKTNGGCDNVWELFFEVYPVFILRDSVAVCESALPYHWERGPIEYRNTDLSAEPGTTREISYSFISTVTGADSVYILKLTVLPQIKKVEQHYFCAGEDVNIYGKTYYLSGSDSVLRDTIMRPNPEAGGCDSIIYLEIYQNPVNRYTETLIMHTDDTITWHNLTITELTTKTYEVREPNATGCDDIYQLRVIAEQNVSQTVCVLDTPFEWRGKEYNTSGLYTDTVITNGVIEEFHSLTLKIDTVPTRYEQVFFCEGDQIKIGDKLYHNLKSDSVYRDTLKIANGENLCDSVIYYEISQYPVQHTIETRILHVDSTIVWNGITINELVDHTYTYTGNTDPRTGCTITEQLRIIAEHRENKTICVLDTPYTDWRGWRGFSLNTTGLYTDTVFDENGFIKEFHSLNFKIDTVPTRVEQHFVCPGYEKFIRGHWYGRPNDPTDTIFRFTENVLSPTSQCDSLIYVEVHVNSVREHTQTIILQEGESYDWNGKTITAGGVYRDTTVVAEGCDSVNILRVIKELRINKTICRTDTAEDTPADKKYPYVWVHPREDAPNDTLYTDGIYTDTTYDADGYITEFYSLHLTIAHPYDTTIYVHGCMKMNVYGEDHSQGAWWYGQPNEIFWNDTSFIFRKEVNPYDPDAPCDSIFYVNVVMDTAYIINITDTICEHELPYILGRNDPEIIWGPTLENPGNNKYQHNDFTVNGCDSIINLTLTIIPSLKKNDSTFVCEEFFENGGFIWLGDTVTPWFDTREGGKYHGLWEGKWHGVPFSDDTIVYNCDSTFSHHIIKRPKQDVPARDTFYLCQGDSVQLFWPHKLDWVHEAGDYSDTVKTYSPFVDETHGTTHYDKNFLCDSIIIWRVYMLDTIHEYDTIHIPMGDSLLFDNEWRFITGVYDSISYAGPDPLPTSGTAIQGANGLDLPLKDSRDQYCKYVKTLYLFVDSTYYYRDTLEICEKPGKGIEYTWQDGYKRPDPIILPKKDSAFHVIDTLPTYYHRFDSIYDLYIEYRQLFDTLLFDTICEGSQYRFDSIHGTLERWVDTPGRYYDTLTAVNGCDSIVTLQLYVRHRVITTPQEVMITDREIPYIWLHQWNENGVPVDSTDTLRASGLYTFVMPNRFGCDSIDSLYLTVHQTHVFRDTIDVCDQLNKTLKHTWHTGYVQEYTTPLVDDTAYYSDTLQTRIKWDSIYVLCVNFHQTYYVQVAETICEGDSLRFDKHHYEMELNSIEERYVKEPGIYKDSLRSKTGCDSIIELRLEWYQRIPNTHTSVTITDREAPYYWSHTWPIATATGYRDTTYVDTLRTSGEYTFRMPSVQGCDSIDSISFTVHQTHVFRDTITVCAPKNRTLEHTWTEGNYTQQFTVPDFDVDTTYHDTLPTVFYLDSIYALYVHYHVIDSTVIHTSICEGDSLRFGDINGKPRFVYSNGVYRDTLTRTTNGCDSIVVLYLNVYQKHLFHQQIDIADVDTPYLWIHTWEQGANLQRDTDSLFISGEYSRVLPSIYGCDSIDSLSLRIHKTYKIYEDTINICYDETPYKWQGLDNITKTGDYQWGGQTVDGYDSVRYVHINVWKQVYDTISTSICEGDSIRWGLSKANRPRFVYDAGLYNDTLVSSRGCDSIIVLRLNIYPRYFNDSTKHIADIDTPYVWIHMQNNIEVDREYLSASGRYGYTYQSALGCDSIDSLTLVVHPTYLFKDSITICYNQTPYTWYNEDSTEIFQEGIYETGTYIKRLQTHDLYDSTYVRYIRVIPVIKDTIRHAMCEGTDYLFNGALYSEGGTYTDTLVSADGCDSIVTLILTVNKPVHVRIPVDIYEGESYLFYDTPYTTSGSYRHYGHTDEGCDSIVELFLTVHKDIDTIVTVCQSELPYTWVNKWSGKSTLLYQAGKYRDDTTYVDGVRTFYTLLLVVNEPQYDTIRTSICEGDDYYFNGVQYTQSGLYRDTLKAANGCDSIQTLILTVNKPYYSTRVEYILEGNSVQFFDTVCKTSGTYYHYGTTPYGCDSTTVLELHVHPAVDTIVNICRNDLPFIWTNRWNGQTEKYYNTGVYRNDTTINAQKYFYGLKINVLEQIFDTTRVSICEGSSFFYKGDYITKQGIYRDTLAAQNGCDSIHTLILTVNQPFFQTIHEDVLEGQSVQFFDTVCKTTGTYYHYGTTPYGCDSTTILELVVHQLVDTIVTVCENDLPYQWNNRWSGEQQLFYSAGTYRNDTTINGKKFFFGLELRTSKQIFDTVQVSICNGGSYMFAGKPVTEEGIYRDTLVAANGCDSIQTLILKLNEPYYTTRTEHIIEGNQFVFFGDTFNTTGVYTHYGKTEYGCDSTSILQLFVHPLVDTVVTVCSSELPYQWVNKWTGSVIELYTEGKYRNDTTYFNGERMFNGLQLIVTQPSDTTIYRDICEGDAYNFNGQHLQEAGEYRDTLKNSIGCDSIVILHLNVLSKYYNIIEHTIPEGDSILFLDQYYSTPGIYPVRFTSSYGCDSIVELRLNVMRLFDDSVSVCANALPYIWTLPSDSTRYKTIYESGIYRDTVTNSEGQQTIIGLKVNVLPIVHAPEAVVATICEGNFFKFGDSVLTEQGTYYDTLVAANGCDSIIMLSLQVLPAQYQSEIRRIFEGDSVFFDGQWLKESGVYERRVTNANNCTDTYQLILTVLKSFNVDTTAVICEDQLPFVWRGYEYNATGDYSLPIAWTDSSRVVKTLHLTVNPTFYGERNISLCYGNLFIYKRDTFKTDTIFYDTIPSLVGCDSILKYVVSVHPTFERWDTVHISDKQSYTYCDGRVLTLQGDYECSGITQSGCDSISHLHLVVHPSYEFKEEESVCQSDTNNYPFQWHGRTFTESGTYYDSLLTHKYGFDSIYELKLVVHPSYFIYEQYLIKEGETTTLHGINITRTDTIYTDTLHTLYGCDSIYQIAVNTKRMMEVDRVVEICDGDFYDLYGKKLTKAGNYTGMNEDTIVHLTLIVNQNSLFKQRIVITEEDIPYIYKGHFYEPEAPVWDKTTQSWDQDVKTTIFADSLINRYGCDSVIRLEFVVTTHYSEWNQIPLCSGSQLIIDSDTIKKAGFYTFVRRSRETGKLDSLYRIEVYESPSYEMPVIKRSICNGDTVMFGGKVFDRNGVHKLTLKSVDGCDSVITLDLTVNPAYYMEKTVSLWPDELPYHWEGRDYYNAGDYPVSWQIGDCDSTRMLHLIVLQPDTQRTVLCEGQAITWHETTYNTSGTYTYTTYDQNNNITAIDVLILTFAHPTQIVSANVGAITEGADRFDINFSYSGFAPTAYNIIFDARAKQAGFTDVYGAVIIKDGVATVNIPQFADTCWNGHARYVRPDNYTLKLVLDNGPCGDSRSNDLQFQIKYPSWIIEQNWDDVVAPLRSECNCGYEFTQTQWLVNNQPQTGVASGYLHSDALNVGDEVVMNAKRKGESYFIPTYPLTIRVYDWQMYDTPILKISPKHAPHYNPYITIDAEVEGVYEIYSSAGNFVSRGSFEQGQTTVTLPTISGLYIIRTHVNNETMTHKVILY